MSTLVTTKAGVFNPAKIIFMSAVTDKKDNTGSFFTIQLEGVTNSLYVGGSREECLQQWSEVISKLPK
jgi:hypothetical protein